MWKDRNVEEWWGKKRHIRTLMRVFQTIFKIRPQTQTGGDADKVLYILCIITQQCKSPLFRVNTCSNMCPFSHGNLCYLTIKGSWMHTLCLSWSVCLCMNAHLLHSVFCELCDCISEAFVGILPRYRQTYLSHHTVSLPPPNPPSLSHSPHVL